MLITITFEPLILRTFEKRLHQILLGFNKNQVYKMSNTRQMDLAFCKNVMVMKESNPILIIFFILTIPFLLRSQSLEIQKGNQQWFHYTNNLRITDHWTIKSEFDYRWKNTFNDHSLYFLRISGQYRINSGVSLTGGYGYFGFYEDDEINKLEHRVYQEACVIQHFGMLKLSHRYRAEERLFVSLNDEHVVNSKIAFRIRYRGQLGFSVGHIKFMGQERPFILNIGDEIMINAGPKKTNNLFDRNWFMITPCVKWNKNLVISFTYNMEHAGTSTPGLVKYNDVMWLTVVHSMDVSKRSIN